MVSNQLPNWAEAVAAFFSIVTLLAVVVAVFQIQHVSRQMHRELEMQYLLRFWNLMDRQSVDYKLEGVLSRTDKVIIQDYLNLCEDQIQLRELGRVATHTWNYWRRDIGSMCADSAIREAISSAPETDYPSLRKLLIDDVRSHDPLARGRVWRFFRGL